jgi:hypothetical protein
VSATVLGSTILDAMLAQAMPSRISCTRAATMSNVDSGVERIGKPSRATV